MDDYKIYKYFVEQNIKEEIKKLEEELYNLTSLLVIDDSAKDRIEAINKEISLKKEELETIRKDGISVKMIDLINGTLIDDETKKSIAIRMGQEERKSCEKTFYEVKKLYKSTQGRSFDRFKNIVSGKKPKWRKISKFSQKELEYLLAVYEGKTFLSNGELRYVNACENMEDSEREKIILDGNWRLFTSLLRNRELLDTYLKREGDRGYGRK